VRSDSEKAPMDKVRRLYLIKHHLLKKASKEDLVRVVSDICGLHAQAARSPYLALWSRVKDFEDQLLDKALFEDKSLVKTWVMRGTLHMIPSTELPVYNRSLRRMWFEHHGRYMRAPEWPSPEQRRYQIYPKILQALTTKPLKRKDLNDKVRSLLKDGSLPYERLFSGWGGILKETAYEGLTVHAEPCERESCIAKLSQWLPSIELSSIGEEEAQKRLFVKYLRGYGPATQQDFSLWSGLMAGDAKRAVENSSSRIEQIKVEDTKGQFWILKEDMKTLDSIDPTEPARAFLLPKFDSILLGHKDRTRIIKDQYKKLVFKPKVGDIAATVLVDGQIAGTWKYTKKRRALIVVIKPFGKITRDDMAEVKQQAKELSQYMGTEELDFSIES
jgi:DNA glycosylase AlkZ-like